MISPDDIGERRQNNNSPTIALVVAALLLLGIGLMSYREFVRSSVEKEFSEREERILRLIGKGAEEEEEEEVTVLYDAQGNPVYVGADGVVRTGGAPPPAKAKPKAVAKGPGIDLPSPEDPDISRMEQSLDQARELGRITEDRFNRLAAGPGAAGDGRMGGSERGEGGAFGYIGPIGSGGEAEISSELPDFLRMAVENPPGGNPEIEAQLSRMRAQVTSAPALAKVVAYDTEWGVVTFDAGAAQGVKTDQRFAVRRGAEVIGWIRVEEVGADQSVGTLVTRNRESDTAVKPELGDDLIDFELF